MCKISVIIPVYNVEKYLAKCLDSIICQTLEDIEIICINDGSKDNSLKILEEYKNRDSRITIINKENSGASSARNRGIEIAKGEYLSFIDSDDYIDSNFLEKLYNAAVKYDADIACANIFREKFLCKYKKYYSTRDAKEKYKLAKIPNCCYIWNKIYRTEKIKICKLTFEENILFEDIEWTHKVLFYLDRMVVVPNVQYNYRINSMSTVNAQSDIHYYDFRNALNKSMKFVQNNKIKINILKKYPWNKKNTFKLFSIPVFVTKETGNSKGFYLFGIIPLIEVEQIDRNI